MLPLLALVAFQESGASFKEEAYDSILGPKSLVVRVQTERMREAKRSPKQAWDFDWNTAGFLSGSPSDPKRMDLRFRLFSQESPLGSARAESVLRLLLRLFAYNFKELRLDHASEFGKVVDAYLCYGGDPGGEQRFDVDRQARGNKVDTIYFYDLRSFTDPVEVVREVAHEYGHATLPPVGGDYAAPEAWANGYLGEKLFLSYLADARTPDVKGKSALGPEDTFGATPEALRAWVRKNVDPLVADALADGPRPALVAGKDKAAMDAFFGLALATARLYGPGVLSRALQASGTDAKAFADAASVAAAEPSLVFLNVTPAMRGKPIWIPLGSDKKKNVVMGATVLERKDGWVRIRPGNGPVLVRNYKD